MNSSELTNLRQWTKWSHSTMWDAPAVSGIYVFRLPEGKTIHRLKGESDILYIGCSTKLRNRFRDHSKAIGVERNIGYRLQRVERHLGALEVSWETYECAENAKDAERLLLARYEADHMEFPPLNRLEPGKRSRVIEELLKLQPGKLQDLL